MKRRILPVFLIVAGLALALGINLTASPRTASAEGATLNLPGADCGDGSANVTFTWAPVPGATTQWLDISIFDNGFAPDSFIGSQVSGSATSLNWNGILNDVPHVWRVNALTPSGWITSSTGAFVPCGTPRALSAAPGCQDRNLATISFRWAPVVPAAVLQYLDLGYDAGFNPGTYYGSNQPVNVGSVNWPNIPANLSQYYRINSLGADGIWRSSPAATVAAGCVPSQLGAEIALGDRLVIPSAGIDTEVWSSKVSGETGVMADPTGYFHATYYDFSAFVGLGGYANTGNLVMAGHVDCGTCYNGGSGTAVFWNVRLMQVGDTAQYITSDGKVQNYVVTLSQDFSPDTDWSPIVNSGVADMTLITCVGNFAGGEYSLRHVVQLRKI